MIKIIRKIKYILILALCMQAHAAIPSDINNDNVIDLKDIVSISAQWLHTTEPICKFMVIADIHYGDFTPYSALHGKRQPNAPDRFYSFVSESNNSDPNFVIQLGDIVDYNSENYIPSLEQYVQDVNDLSDYQIYHTMGNHGYYKLIDEPNYISPYFDLITKTLPNNIENIWSSPDYNENYPCAYTFDIGENFRGVVLHFPYEGAVGDQDISWIASAIDVDKPVITFSHATPPTETKELLSSAPNVIMHFKGHHHGGTYEEYNGFPIYGLKGSVRTPEYDDYTANVYYSINMGFINNGELKKVYVNIDGFVRGEDFFYISNKEF